MVSVSLSVAAVLLGLYLLVTVITSGMLPIELPITAVPAHILEFVLLIALSLSLGIAIMAGGEQL